MNFLDSVRVCFSKSFDFTGRARLSEYWWFQLFLITVTMIAFIIDTVVLDYTVEDIFAPFGLSCNLLTIFPVMAVTCRRLHDVGMSGWYQAPMFVFALGGLEGFIPSAGGLALFGFVFFVYLLWLLIVLIRDSEVEANQYGANPKL